MSKDYQQTATDDKGKGGGQGNGTFQAALDAMEKWHRRMVQARNILMLQTKQINELLDRARSGETEILTWPSWYEYCAHKWIRRAEEERDYFEQAIGERVESEDSKRLNEIRDVAPTLQAFTTLTPVEARERREKGLGPPPSDGSRPAWVGPKAELESVYETPDLWIECWNWGFSGAHEWVVCRKESGESALIQRTVNPRRGTLQERRIAHTDYAGTMLESFARAYGIDLELVYERPCSEVPMNPHTAARRPGGPRKEHC